MLYLELNWLIVWVDTIPFGDLLSCIFFLKFLIFHLAESLVNGSFKEIEESWVFLNIFLPLRAFEAFGLLKDTGVEHMPKIL